MINQIKFSKRCYLPSSEISNEIRYGKIYRSYNKFILNIYIFLYQFNIEIRSLDIVSIVINVDYVISKLKPLIINMIYNCFKDT